MAFTHATARRTQASTERAQAILLFLSIQPSTMDEIANEFQIHPTTAADLVKVRLRGRVHVAIAAHRDRGVGRWLPAVWAAGSRPEDAAAIDHAQATARLLERLRRQAEAAAQAREVGEEEYFRKLKLQLVAEIRPHRSPLDVAFFGPAGMAA